MRFRNDWIGSKLGSKLFLVVTGLMTAGLAQGNEEGPYHHSFNNVVETLCRFNAGSLDLTKRVCEITEAEKKKIQHRKCFTHLNQKSEINFNLTLGYFELRFENPRHPYQTLDRYIHRMMIDFLTNKDCPSENVQACGFELEDPLELNPAILKKTITLPNGFRQTIRLSLMYSSVNLHNDVNMTSQEQADQSKKAEETFHSGLKSADASFYMGHWRKQGGPSFIFPELIPPTSIDGPINYERYAERLGIKKMLAAIEERKTLNPNNPSTFLSLQACGTETSQKAIERLSPKTSLLLTKNVDGGTGYGEQIFATLLGIDSLIAGRCQKEIEAGLEQRMGRKTQVLTIKKPRNS